MNGSTDVVDWQMTTHPSAKEISDDLGTTNSPEPPEVSYTSFVADATISAKVFAFQVD